MSREEVIAKIRRNADAIRALGAGSLYLYGSHARDEAGAGSDIDVFIDRDPRKHFGFISSRARISPAHPGADVDVSTRTGLHPALSQNRERRFIGALMSKQRRVPAVERCFVTDKISSLARLGVLTDPAAPVPVTPEEMARGEGCLDAGAVMHAFPPSEPGKALPPGSPASPRPSWAVRACPASSSMSLPA
jgi:predicted nucleotidyltransferase